MKNLIIVMMMAMILGVSSNEVLAQKKGNKVVCFKSNMDCAACEKTLTDHLKFEKGVKDLRVDHASNTILIEYKEGKNTDEALVKSITKKGYEADKITKEQYKEIVEHTHEAGHEHGAEVHKERK